MHKTLRVLGQYHNTELSNVWSSCSNGKLARWRARKLCGTMHCDIATHILNSCVIMTAELKGKMMNCQLEFTIAKSNFIKIAYTSLQVRTRTLSCSDCFYRSRDAPVMIACNFHSVQLHNLLSAR